MSETNASDNDTHPFPATREERMIAVMISLSKTIREISVKPEHMQDCSHSLVILNKLLDECHRESHDSLR